MTLSHVNSLLRLALLACALLTACQPSMSEEDLLRRKLEARAAQAAPRANVALGYIHQHRPPLSADEVLEIESAHGTILRIERFFLISSAIELHGCEPGYDQSLGRAPAWYQGLPLIKEAHAHVPSSATRIGVPFVEDLLGPANHARMVGGIAPPFARYCRMYAILSPADDDILNLTSALTEELEGLTLLIEGTWREDSEAAWQPLRLTTSARLAIEMELIDASTARPPLTLIAAGDHALVLVEKTLSPKLFADLSPEALTDGSAGDTVLESLAKTFRMYRYEAPAP